jgi:hypothetical protein
MFMLFYHKKEYYLLYFLPKLLQFTQTILKILKKFFFFKIKKYQNEMDL